MVALEFKLCTTIRGFGYSLHSSLPNGSLRGIIMRGTPVMGGTITGKVGEGLVCSH